MLWPARMVRVNRSIASGSCSSNLLQPPRAHAQNIDDRREAPNHAAIRIDAGRTSIAEQADISRKQHDRQRHAESEHVGRAVLQVGLIDDSPATAAARPTQATRSPRKANGPRCSRRTRSGGLRSRLRMCARSSRKRVPSTLRGLLLRHRPHVVARRIQRDREDHARQSAKKPKRPSTSLSPRASRGRSMPTDGCRTPSGAPGRSACRRCRGTCPAPCRAG